MDAPLPDDAGGTIRHVQDHTPTAFLWEYERSRPQLVKLYDKATTAQWASVTDLDWSIDVDPERIIDWESPLMTLARAAKDLGYGITIAADACTTRDLPSPTGTIPARALHDAELAGLADHHGAVVDVAALIAPRG